MKLENKTRNVLDDLEIEIVNDSIPKECRDTTKNKIWKRNCPICNVKILVSSEKYYKKCVELNSNCLKCGIRKSRPKIEIPDRFCPQCNLKLSNYKTDKIRLCKQCVAKNRYKENPNVKTRLSSGLINRKYASKNDPRPYSRKCPNCEKVLYHTSISYVKKHKNSLCRSCSSRNSIDKLGNVSIKNPSYNKYGCMLIDEYGKQNGYNFQHALNGGECRFLGYFVDGYDKDKNVVIEYDEKHHFKFGKLKEKDLNRMNEIIDHLKCKFIRLKDDGIVYMSS